ncbi:hypothetical protein [Mycobacterium sp. MS1601]|uniref:hypothetical protein n=1 Tax=Mycobacterium sp. MS1601 TaxID=1936029 RepID=UPI001F314ED0|nr:hypothetical protein [Mycobacterium sp. MS1601]
MPIVETSKLAGFIDRVMEIASTQAPWHRRLWRGGTMELAQEFLLDSARPGARELAIAERRKHLMSALRTDHGIADFGKCIEAVAKEIKPDTDETSHAWIALRHHLEEMNAAYLPNWAQALDNPPPNRPVDTEGAARRITGHILGAGMHKNSLYSWLRDVQSKDQIVTPSDLLREADRRLKAPEKIYTFCVPVDKNPRSTSPQVLPVDG